MIKLIALDVGKKRIGIAVSIDKNVFERNSVLANRKGIEEIIRIIKEENSSKIIIGLPYLESGKEGEQAKFVRKFADRLCLKSGLPILFFDERFSSIVAREKLQELGIKEYKIAERIDSMSAKIILEDYISKEGI